MSVKQMEKDNAATQTSLELKDEGNAHFKSGDYEKALACYSQALKQNRNPKNKDTDREKEKETGVIFKNRAACYLKLENYESAIKDATEALEILPNDTKALFRRCQALEQLGKMEEAFKDARTVRQIDPKNSAVVPVLQRLGSILQTKSDRFRTTDGLVDEMLSALCSGSSSEDQKSKAMKNLVILAKDEPGAQRIFRAGAVPQIVSLLNGGSNDQTIAVLKVLKGLCTNSKSRSLVVLQLVTDDKLLNLVKSSSDDVSVAAVTVVSQALESLIPLREKKSKDKDVSQKLDDEEVIRVIFMVLLEASRSKEVCAKGRDAVIDSFIRAFPRNVLAVHLFRDIKGVRKLLDVAACTAPCESVEKRPLAVTESTRMHISLALAGMFEMFGYDKTDKERFLEDADAAVSHYMNQNSDAGHIEGSTILCCLLQGVREAATPLLNKEEVLDKVVRLATKQDRISQTVAAETLAIAASDKTTCSAITSQAMTVLTALYNSKEASVQVRALVGFCKVNSVGGGAVNEKNFPKGTSEKLYKSVRSFLVGPQQDTDSRKWAAEGLSFLTMDADVKEIFLADKEALTALLNLAKAKDSSLLYGVCQTFVNLTNTYDKPDIPEEMKKLGEFAKVKLPEFSEKDNEEYVNKRIDRLVKEGVISALASLSNTDSNASREMISRVFMGIATKPEHRGLMVQHGGVKALLSLAHENTNVGKDIAAHSLAKVAISMNPEVAFPGQRSFSLVRPLISLLHTSKTGLQQFESLMALTNLAQMSDEVRKHIVKERGVVEIESLMFDEHELVKRAATECMCNMIMCEEVFKLFENENSPTERVKLLTVYSGEEDFHLARAAAGGLAMLTSSEKVCNQIIKVGVWLDIMKELLLREETELVHRGTHIVANLMAASKEIATKLVESEILEMLMVFSKETDPERSSIRECAERALHTATELELIKPNMEK